ncbi:hypothetical protein [Paenibacillus sonchi]|uniref:hypothetical protein n=1 Tax=Paenibacillus sonchi TaxID=373687 RepID=UPI001E2F6923|nr:hypothetical protein [Paenibacillus sonchi]MCE3202811.1 hypothetical protein [Paenibacillus sonchi]
MKKTLISFLFIILIACSNDNSTVNPENALPTETNKAVLSSYPYPLVKWNNALYRVTTEENIDTDEPIGEILNHSNDDTNKGSTPDNSSNFYSKGTKLWSIKDVDTDEAIAVEYEPNKFVKAVLDQVTK